MTSDQSDAPVFVIDLREPAGTGEGDAPPRADLGVAEEAVAKVAIVHPDGAIDLRPIEPTRDLRYLDALARLLRFAHARGETVRRVAARYGTEYERRLLFEKRLPGWALDFGRRPA